MLNEGALHKDNGAATMKSVLTKRTNMSNQAIW